MSLLNIRCIVQNVPSSPTLHPTTEMVNTLTRNVGISFGPIILETLVKHYFERLKGEHHVGKGLTQLRKDELLYDEAFNVIKVPITPPIYQTAKF